MDMSKWTVEEQQLHEQRFPTSPYQFDHLKAEVLAALEKHFGSQAVKAGGKSIKVQTSHTGRPSDVIPALQYRRYAPFTNLDNPLAHWGMQFFDSNGGPVINYPTYHIERGIDKNSDERTGGRYKSFVRIFKNLRNWMVDNDLVATGVAPSYFVECALFNVPDAMFRLAFNEGVPTMIAHLLQREFGTLMCQNGVTSLIGNASTEWSESDFTRFIVAADAAWKKWPSTSQ